MTTAFPMLFARCVLALLGVVSLLWLSACEAKPREMPLSQPMTLDAPYSSRDVIWAVVPLTNESGTSLPDELAITDALVNTIREVDGLSALPTNRVINAMRAMQMPGVYSPADARKLAQALGADAILVGSITAWNPYHPPQLGMTIALFARTDKMRMSELSRLDPLVLRQAMTDAGISVDEFRDMPVALVAGHYDAANHAVLSDVRRYATGRHDPRTSLGWEYYTKSMARYTEFVSFRVVAELLHQERQRVTPTEASIR